LLEAKELIRKTKEIPQVIVVVAHDEAHIKP